MAQPKYTMKYYLTQDNFVWYPELRTIVLIDNRLESVAVGETSLTLVGQTRTVEFFYGDLIDGYRDVASQIDPDLFNAQGNLYRCWHFRNFKENIFVLIMSAANLKTFSRAPKNFTLSKQYFLDKRKAS